MIEFKPIIVHEWVYDGIPANNCFLQGVPVAFVGIVGNFYGPAGRTKREAQERLLEYMQSDVGIKHYKDVYPDTDDSKYQEVLFELYELEDMEYFRKSLTAGLVPPDEQKSPL